MKIIKLTFLFLATGMLMTDLCLAMGGAADTRAAQAADSAAQAMQEARQELNQAAADFSNAEKQANGQQTRQAPLSEALGQPQAQTQDTSNQTDPRNQALQGSPATGYAGTWTDPATGDVMTSVIAPAPQSSQQQNYPMIIEPQVSGGSYYGGQAGGWQQWPTSPDNPGYPPVIGPNYGNGQNQHYPGWMPPYPGQPYPGFNPYPGMNYPPGWWAGQQPGHPPFNPNYRPLGPPRPPHGPGINPGGHIPGFMPPSAGGNQPGFNPPSGFPPNNPGSLWQPGMNRPQGAPPMQQLPMRPSGNTWNNPGRPQRPGMFGGSMF